VGIGLEREVAIKSKILTHFIKSKIYLTPMETILIILGIFGRISEASKEAEG
jgi:hypothetical protein